MKKNNLINSDNLDALEYVRRKLLHYFAVFHTLLPTHASCRSFERMMHIKGAFFYSPDTRLCVRDVL